MHTHGEEKLYKPKRMNPCLRNAGGIHRVQVNRRIIVPGGPSNAESMVSQFHHRARRRTSCPFQDVEHLLFGEVGVSGSPTARSEPRGWRSAFRPRCAGLVHRIRPFLSSTWRAGICRTDSSATASPTEASEIIVCRNGSARVADHFWFAGPRSLKIKPQVCYLLTFGQ